MSKYDEAIVQQYLQTYEELARLGLRDLFEVDMENASIDDLSRIEACERFQKKKSDEAEQKVLVDDKAVVNDKAKKTIEESWKEFLSGRTDKVNIPSLQIISSGN